eukprot:scaffold1401_cov330-Pavlova_lutheri.AAC.73
MFVLSFLFRGPPPRRRSPSVHSIALPPVLPSTPPGPHPPPGCAKEDGPGRNRRKVRGCPSRMEAKMVVHLV